MPSPSRRQEMTRFDMTRSPCLRPLLLLTLVLAALSCASIAAEGSSPPVGRLAAALQPFVDNHLLAGAVVMVATTDKLLDVEAVGYADLAARKPMRTDCLFWIASQSKPIAAAAVMMLVDESPVNGYRLKLDDPVEKYLPEFAGQMVAAERDKEHVLLRKPHRPISVRDVLSHTSGLPFSTPIEKPTLDLFPLACRVRSYAMTPLDFEPGSKNQYSNAGVNTAARIVEVVGKLPYERFLDERLFKPLGMKDTTFPPDERAASTAGQGLPARQARPGGMSHRPASLSLGRSAAAADARGRPVLDGRRPFPFLPDVRPQRQLQRPADSLRGRRPRDDDAATGLS